MVDAKRTSPYKFYQYWLNTSDEDAEKYIKIFTFLDEATIKALISEHENEKHLKKLQKRLAQEVTTTVHSEPAYDRALKASEILFSKTAAEDLKKIDKQTFLEIFDGVDQTEISKNIVTEGLDIIGALAEKTGFLKSNGEAIRALKENSISVNLNKVSEGYIVNEQDLINGQFILIQRGKKNKFIIKVV